MREQLMGYDAHITKARHWTDSESQPVSDAEWAACVADDPDLEFVEAAEADTGAGVLRYENPGLTAWRGHPSGDPVWLDHRGGEVVVKNPDEPTLVKMIAVARMLGAHVEGDDGERYESPGQAPEPAPAPGPVSLRDRLAGWFTGRSHQSADAVDMPFRAGDRVKDMWNQAGRVVAVDATAEHGLGVIRVRFDDGREVSVSAAAHGLEPID
jgi:hypothetical protein